MKITYRGTPPEDEVWKGRCYKCGSRAEAKEGELGRPQRCWVSGVYCKVKCPVCNAGEMFFSPGS